MLSMVLDESTMREIEAADQAGIKLERIEGLPVWEFLRTLAHQETIQQVFLSVRKSPQGNACDFIRVLDLLVLFPGGSFRRPDLSIFCEPPQPRDRACETIPAAVIEVISADSREKDLNLSPPFYLKHGVLDVIVIDPGGKTITRFDNSGRQELRSPQDIELKCGCTISV